MSDPSTECVLDLLVAQLERGAEGATETFKAGPGLESVLAAHLDSLEEGPREAAMTELLDGAKTLAERGAQKVAERVEKLIEKIKNGGTVIPGSIKINDGFEPRAAIFCATDWMGGVGSSRAF